MSVTSGFYDAKNGDRRYSAKQMSSIFDGIIRDGVFMNYGSAFSVKAGSGMEVTVGIGRAWFNHTWTLNDAILPLPVSPSEVILNRIDAVVLEVDTRESVRANSIKIVKGVSATNPSRPTLIKSGDRWQYPLAYITINSGITSIRQSMITNMVGTESCPFVTAPLESMNIDNIVSQWRDQWVSFYDEQVRLILGQKTTYLEDVDSFNRQIKDNLNAKKAEFENEIREYLTYLHGVLDGDTAANIAGRLLKLESKEVEVIDNLTTDDPSKPVSARQGMLLSKEINKKGISIIDAYETNNVFDCSGDSSKKIVPGVPFFMNIKSVTHSVLNINHQTRARIRTESGVEEVDIRGLNSSPINVINSSIRILLCVFDTYLKVDTTNTSLDYKIQQAFQLAHEGKQMLSDALVSKGLVVDSGASFQEMAERIRESLMSKSEDSLNKVYSNGGYVNYKIVNVKEFYKRVRISISKDVNQELYNLLKTRQYGYRFEYQGSSKSSIRCEYINRYIDSYNLFCVDGNYYVVFTVKYRSTNDDTDYIAKSAGLKIRAVFAKATINGDGRVLLSNYKILTEVDNFYEKTVASVVVVKENKVFVVLPYDINQSQLKVKVFKYTVRNGSIIFEGYNTDRKLSEIVASGMGSQSGSELTETEIEIGDGVIYDLWTEKIRNKRHKVVNIESFEPYTRLKRGRTVRKVEVKTGAETGFYALAYTQSQSDVVEIYRYNESGWIDRITPICTKNFIRGKISASSGYSERVLNKAFVKHYAYIAFPYYHLDMDNIVVYDIRKNQLYHIREFFDSLKLYKTKIYTGYEDRPYSDNIGVSEFVPSIFDEAVVYFQNREWMSSSDDKRRGYLGRGNAAEQLLLYRRDDGKSFLSEQYTDYHQRYSFLKVRSHNDKPQYLRSYLNGSVENGYHHVDESDFTIESETVNELIITGSTYEIVEDFRK